MLTNKSPGEFIRSIRLKKAAYLLGNSQMTISQICYEVGFNTPNILRKCSRKNITYYLLRMSIPFVVKKIIPKLKVKNNDLHAVCLL
jgi:AraC-like DNA-binding protein